MEGSKGFHWAEDAKDGDWQHQDSSVENDTHDWVGQRTKWTGSNHKAIVKVVEAYMVKHGHLDT